MAKCPYCNGVEAVASQQTNRLVVRPEACKVRVKCSIFTQPIRPPISAPCPHRKRAEAKSPVKLGNEQ